MGTGKKDKKMFIEFFDFSNFEKSEQVRRSTLIRIILLSCLFGLFYSVFYMTVFDINVVADVIVTYILLSTINLVAFYFGKNYNVFKTFQFLLITVLPIVCQLFIGGFAISSAISFVAVLAPLGALMLYDIKKARWLLLFFIVSICAAGYVEYEYLEESIVITRGTKIVFFVVVITHTAAVIFGLLEFIVKESRTISTELKVSTGELSKAKKEIEKQNIELLRQKREILKYKEELEERNKAIQRRINDV